MLATPIERTERWFVHISIYATPQPRPLCQSLVASNSEINIKIKIKININIIIISE